MTEEQNPDRRPHVYNEIHRFFDYSLDLFGIAGFDGYMKRVNPAWERVLGYTTDELLSRPAADFIHPDDRSASLALRPQMQSGVPVINFENRYVCKDGSIKWLQWTAHPYPDEGLNYLVGRDVTERKQAEAALRQNQDAMRALLNGMPNRSMLMQPDGTILIANDLQAAGFGHPVSEVIGANFYDLTPMDAEAQQQRRNSINKVIASKKPLVVEVERGGNYFETTITPILTESDEVVSIVISGHDITHLKQVEEGLRQSERMLREFIDASPGMTVVTDLDGRIVMYNEQFAAYYNRPNHDLSERNIYELLSLVNAEHRRAYSQVVIETQKPVHFQSESKGRFFRVTIFPVFNAEHQVVRLGSSIQDVTDLWQAETALRASEQQLRSVLDSAAQGIMLVNARGKITLLNQYAEKQFGYEREELLDQPIEVLLPEALRGIHQQHREMYLHDPETRPMGSGLELKGQRKDGSVFPVEVSLSYMDNAGNMLVMAFVSDISERKQMEQERLDTQRIQMEIKQERDIIALRQQFMSMVSHEFRTPLTVIASSSEILQHYDDRLSRERRVEKLQVISSQVRTMVTLLDDILALNKIQSGLNEFTPEALDLLSLCMTVLNNIKVMDQDQHRFILDSQLPSAEILADRRLLEHSITNLLSNAVKYSPPETTIQLLVRTAEKAIDLEIRDQGIGIPTEDQKHLFEPFYRAHNARKIEGTGLGLAIVKHNVEQHGGTITCQSEEGRGTTFSIHLPVKG